MLLLKDPSLEVKYDKPLRLKTTQYRGQLKNFCLQWIIPVQLRVYFLVLKYPLVQGAVSPVITQEYK